MQKTGNADTRELAAGLTGGPGCGKSAVLKIFSGLGWKTVDSDNICSGLYGRESIRKALADRWGSEVLCGEDDLDRKMVAGIVFSSLEERQWLNKLIHPEVLKRVQIEISSSRGRPLMADVPLLFESEWRECFNHVLAVWCSPDIQRERLLRRGWSDGEIDRRLASQMSSEKKLAMSDIGIINNGSKSLLIGQCKIISSQLQGISL